MPLVRAITALLALAAAPAFAQSAPAPRDVTVAAPDGTELKATYYAAARRGPGVLLLHMCNTTRQSWAPLGPQLAAAGIHAIAVDYRGFGESGGPRFDSRTPQENQATIDEKWPGDIDAVYKFLLDQSDVDSTRIGAAGGSCGVNQAVKLAQRHPEVRSLVLLAGGVDAERLLFLQRTTWLPLFAAAAADDQFDGDAPGTMQWILEMSGNPRNKFSGFKDGRHGTEIFGPHPELVKQIVAWYVDTLVKNPADKAAPVQARNTPAREFWQKASTAEGVPAAVQLFYDTRLRDPRARLFPEQQLNLLGYQYLQSGNVNAAIQVFRLNTLAYPRSANTYDSLADAYLANQQNELALRMSERAIELLADDRSSDAQKQAIRESAEQKIAKLKDLVKKQ
jgi:dienelactone hydrolase